MMKKNVKHKKDGVIYKTIGGKEYLVKSVFVGKKDIRDSILKLAEYKTIKEMGMV